jgi:AcrR family transcriptional regulator
MTDEGATERREQILRAALSCFSAKGYYRTTMDDIVAESGLSKGTLYWYFDGKKDLFVSLFRTTMERFREEWEVVAADEGRSARDKLLASLDLYRSELAELVPLFGLMMEAWALTRHDEDVSFVTRGLYEPYREIIDRILWQGMDVGEFDVEDVRATALVLIILLDGVTLAMGTALWERDWDQVLDAATTFVLRGLGAGKGSDA